MIEQTTDKYLIKLQDCSEQQKYDLIREKITKFPKFFFDIRTRTQMIYDQTCIYIISKQQTKVCDLGKQHAIVQLIYNPIKNILIFLTHDHHLIAHFVNHKTQLTIKKDFKKEAIFSWIYAKDNIDLFLAQQSGVRLMKIDEEKKAFRQVKFISCKFNSFLYEPMSQVLVGFPVGDCKTVYTFLFDDDNKAKNWFKGPQVAINIQSDQNLRALAKKNKSLGLKSSRNNCQLFYKDHPEDFAAELIHINNKCYIVFYFGMQGKLKLVAISQQPQKQISIKLPSDCVPSFVVVDNMLVIHMKNEKITFIYDINNVNAQMLVSPFPVEHATRSINPYSGVFIGNRHIMPDGNISKWIINVSVIFHYLKNQLQVFDFLLKREKAKPQLLTWLRQNLLKIKQINLSKFWKLIFVKMQSQLQREKDVITLSQLYANIFYTLANDQLTPMHPLLNIMLQCIRQAKQMQIKIPFDLQRLIFDLLIQCKKYETLVFLCHNDIIKDNQQFVESLMRKATKQNEQILLTLAIDMANRVCKPQKVFEMLILSQRVWQARRYMKQNHESIEVLFMVYASKGIRDEIVRKQFLKLTRAFILKKYPSITEKYLDQAQYNVYQSQSPMKSHQQEEKENKEETV